MPRPTKGFICGSIKPLWKCLSDLKQAETMETGEITITMDRTRHIPRQAFWMCVKVDPKDPRNNSMQRIFPTEEQIAEIKNIKHQ